MHNVVNGRPLLVITTAEARPRLLFGSLLSFYLFNWCRSPFLAFTACFDLVTSSPQSPGKLLARVAKRREVQFCAQFLCVSWPFPSSHSLSFLHSYKVNSWAKQKKGEMEENLFEFWLHFQLVFDWLPKPEKLYKLLHWMSNLSREYLARTLTHNQSQKNR